MITEEQFASIKDEAIDKSIFFLDKNPAVSEVILKQLLKCDPENLSGLQLLGLAKHRMGKNIEAIEIFQTALDIDPHNSDNMNNIALAYGDLEKYERAIEYAEKAVNLSPEKFLFRNNLALHYRCVKRHEDAIRTLETSIKKAGKNSPEAAQIWNNLGGVYSELGQIEKSIECFNKGLECDPAYPAGHVSLSFAYQLLGDLEKGFEEYEWRKEYFSQMQYYKKSYDQTKLWDGKKDLSGKKVLIYAEQGLGDAIQFMRYIPELKSRGAYVMVHCSNALSSLFGRLDCIDQVVHRDIVNNKGEEFPEYDFQLCMMSLPLLLNQFKPSGKPYIEAVTGSFRDHIEEEYGKDTKKIGIVWAGSPAHPYDQFRSIPLKHFKCLQSDDVKLFSLQLDKRPRSYSHSKDQRVIIESKHVDYMEDCEDMQLVDLSNMIQSMEDTCTIIAGLDLVISCDTSVVHLAGAMGVPCYLCITKNPDWRWKTEGDETDWYDSVKIFRQEQSGNWETVFENIEKELNENFLQNK